MNWDETFSILLKFAISLLSVLNPIGAIPIFLSLTQENTNDEIKKIASACAIAVTLTILIVVVAGQEILSFFSISLQSFRIGGGILMGMMAIRMMRAQPLETKLSQEEIETQVKIHEIGIVPLAIPLLAGPGTLSTAIIQTSHFEHRYHWIGAVFVVIFLGIFIKLILNFSRFLGHRIGRVGLNITTRVMGLILMAVAVEYVTHGLKEIFLNPNHL